MARSGMTLLSLQVGDRGVVIAQVATGRGTPLVQRVARFDAPEGARLLDRPAETGALLSAFLAGHAFAAKRAVVGVPARWLIAQDRELPPADAAAAANLLRLAAERMSLAESGALVTDYAGALDTKNGGRVLLIGVLRATLDKVRLLVEAAGLTLDAVCPTSLAIARVAGGSKSVLRLSDDEAELVLQDNGNPRLLQPLTVDPAALGAELKRTLLMRGAGGTELLLVDGVGLTAPQSADLAGRLAAPPAHFDEATLGVRLDPAARNGAAATLSEDAHWPAVALALAASDRRLLPVNFADSKLKVVPPRRFGRTAVLAALAALTVVGGMAYLIHAVGVAEADAEALAVQLRTLDKPVKEAKTSLDQIAFGRGFFDERPSALQCLREVTGAFHYDEPIWASAFVYKSTGQVQVQGKSTVNGGGQSLIFTVLDRLKANKGFEVEFQNSGDAGGKEPLKTFSIAMTYKPTKATTRPATQPASQPARRGK